MGLVKGRMTSSGGSSSMATPATRRLMAEESVTDAALRVHRLADQGKIVASPSSAEGSRALAQLAFALRRIGLDPPSASERAMAAARPTTDRAVTNLHDLRDLVRRGRTKYVIGLNGGAVSLKTIALRGKKWDVTNHIDDSRQTLNDAELWTESHIGEALDKGALVCVD